jgi:hypothetical protein
VHVLAVVGLDEHAHGEHNLLQHRGPSFGVAVNVGLEARDAPEGLEPVGVPRRGRRQGWGVGETGVLTSQ